MISNQFKTKKIDTIKGAIKQKPLYEKLFEFLGLKYDQEDYMKAEVILEQVDIGEFYIKIIEPSSKLLDFFKKNGFNLKVILPALETDSYNYNVTAWLEKEN